MDNNNIEYFKIIASSIEYLLEAIMNHKEKVNFTCSDFKKNLLTIKCTDAYYIDDDGKEQKASENVILNAMYVNYLLTFYLAKDNITDESFEKVSKMINYIVIIHKKLHESVDPNKQSEFIELFKSLISNILSENDTDTGELIIAYIRICQNQPMFG